MEHWPDTETIAKILPHRSEASIRRFASKCNLTEPPKTWSESDTRLLRKRVSEGVSAREIGQELGVERQRVVSRMRYLGLQFPRRPPKLSGDRLKDSVLRRAWELNLTRRDLDEAFGTKERFQNWSLKTPIPLKLIVKAVHMLEGELTVEWSKARD